MDGFLDKLGIYDFFNMIGVGSVFLGGLHIIGIVEISTVYNFFHVDNAVLDTSIFLGVCFIIGTLFQRIAAQCCKRNYREELEQELLSDDSQVTTNKLKRKEHKARLRNLLDSRDINSRSKEIDIQYEYYFSHCEYTIHVCDKDKKTERIRNLRELTCVLIACFGSLAILASIKVMLCILAILLPASFFNSNFVGIIDLMFNISSEWQTVGCWFLSCCILWVMCLVNYYSYRRNTRVWMRMVLDVYKACTDCNNRVIVARED